MRYIGSKVSSVENIHNIVSKHVKKGTFCDPFGGTATVSSFFKTKGYRVHTGDLLQFAHFYQVAKLSKNRKPTFKKLKKHLKLKTTSELLVYFNSLKSTKGWLIKNYSVSRKFFTRENAGKIQACWYKIIQLDKLNLLNPNEKAFLLASLIESMDKVANTAGTYYAYLKSFDRKAKNDFKFEFIVPAKGKFHGKSYKLDALELLKKQKFDVVYLDPPYNSRKYNSYYHLPETIASCDKPKISGKSGVSIRDFDIESNFYSSSSALTSLKTIIDSTNFRLLVFHYSDDGLIKPKELKALFKNYSFKKETNVDCLGYTTKSTKRNSSNHIYLISNDSRVA